MAAASSAAKKTLAVEKKQILTFAMVGEVFGMDIDSVREVIEYGGVTQVPLMPHFVKGVINLRGDVVPVFDLSVRVGRKPCQIHRRTCIVIVQVMFEQKEQVIGLIVDAVNEVIEISLDDIESTPNFGLKLRTEFVAGVAKHNDGFVVLLDAENVLSLDEMTALVAEQISNGDSDSDDDSSQNDAQ